MSVIHNDLLLSSDEGGYNIAKSLRFRSSASAYLNRTPGSSGNTQKLTWSGWVKYSTSSTYSVLFSAQNTAGTDQDAIYISNGQNISIILNGSAASVNTSQLFRDPSAWYHIVLAIDTTQSTASDRIKLYINGSQVTAFSSASYPTQNYNFQGWNVSGRPQFIGTQAQSYPAYTWNGYIAEVNFIDGQQLTPSSFGETDATTGVWKPKRFSGTYGTNGFYLPFTDVATTSGSNAGLGKDFSGNGNYWTTNNISVTAGATYDSMTDVPTLTDASTANYATLNPIQNASVNSGSNLFSDGNLKVSNSNGSGQSFGSSSISVSSGKFYAEMLMNNKTSDASAGAWKTPISNAALFYLLPDNIYYYSGGAIYYSGSATGTTYSSYTTGDVIGIALDMDNGKIYFSKNGTWQGSSDPSTGTSPAYTGLTGSYQFGAGQGGSGGSQSMNFGQRQFAYTPPTGFKALNTYNLPDSTIKAGNKVMDATTYAGNSASRSITNAGSFKPDFVWIKDRTSGTPYHQLQDSVRGATKQLFSNATDAEDTNTTKLTSFDTTGFSLGNSGAVNASGDNYVAWQWQAGQGTTSSNTSGSITSTVSVNASAGFSIVTYTGTGSSGTVGHSLGVAPKFIIYKTRGNSRNWLVNIGAVTGTQGDYIYLNADQGKLNSSNVNNGNSTTFPVSGSPENNESGISFVAYCWSEISGFSKFGTYVGNGSTDGSFVYTGFRPKCIIIKSTSNASDWTILDSSRNTYNLINSELNPNNTAAEYVANTADFLSNGFKLRSTYGNTNGSSYNYVYMAFAENPFKNALAR